MSLFQKIEDYSPLEVDIGFVEEICSKIPTHSLLDINEAERLATVFLECADRVTDEIARCSAYAGYCEANRRDCKAQAIDGRVTGKTGLKVAATIAAQTFGSDPLYIEGHKKQALADAFLDWLRTKYKNLMAAHVLCKDVLKIHAMSRDQGNWKSARPHDIDDEDDELGRASNNSDSKSSSSDETKQYGACKW